ncbi:MAG: hypothetical protein FWF15_10640 [Oscillospiraceae bacterium]|nr:hypothetical protein [Oscillospiraceae bacterium]
MGIFLISLAAAIIAAIIQIFFYKFTKKRFTMFIIPVTCLIPTIYLLLKYSGYSILSKDGGLWVIAFFIGIPIVIGSLLTGIIITIVKSKKK